MDAGLAVGVPNRVFWPIALPFPPPAGARRPAGIIGGCSGFQGEAQVTEKRSWESARPWPVYFMAAAIPISLAAVNVAKALMFAFALAAVLAGLLRGRRLAWGSRLHTPYVVMAMLAALALSLL